MKRKASTMLLLTDENETTDSSIVTTTQNTKKSSETAPADEPKPSPVKKTTSYPSNLKVLLDIDHTMILTQYFDSKAEAQAYADGLPTLEQKETDVGNSNNSMKKATVEYLQIETDDDKVVHMNLRPGLKAFLQEVGTTFETHIYTAGSAEYAKWVAKTLDPDGTLFGDRFWSREHCQGQQDNVRYSHQIWKDVSKLPFEKDLDRIVLIDDLRSNLNANPSNMILVKEFKDDPKDTVLVSVLRILKYELSDERVDVRPVLEEKYEEDAEKCKKELLLFQMLDDLFE